MVGLWIFVAGFGGGYEEKVPCRVSQFEIYSEPDEDEPFRVKLAFDYRVEGRSFKGSQLSPGFTGSSQFEKLAKLRKKVFRGEEGFMCFVHAEDPSDAVLLKSESSHLIGLLFAAFGGGFVVIGLGLILTAIRKGRKSKVRSSTAPEEEKMGGLLGCGFFGVFAAAGVAIFGVLVVPTAVKYMAAKSWVETPAQVIWSRVRQHYSSDGTTYRADVFYEYQFEGQRHRSNSYSLLGKSSSSGRSGKAKIVESYAAGTPVTCYVNPSDPVEALIERRLGWWSLMGLFPVPFAAVGFGGLYYTFFAKGKKKERSSSVAGKARTRERVTRKPPLSPLRKRGIWVMGAFVFAAFWNGIVSVFLWQLWGSWKSGSIDWFLGVFMIPFVLIGIGLILHFFYRVAAVFSPVYQVDFDRGSLRPGDSTMISWQRVGGSGSPRKVSLRFIGREKAEYRRGTSTAMATELFHEELLSVTSDRLVMSGGNCRLVLPYGAVPTFRGRYSKLQWWVILKVEVPLRPDVYEEYEVDVLPPKEFDS